MQGHVRVQGVWVCSHKKFDTSADMLISLVDILQAVLWTTPTCYLFPWSASGLIQVYLFPSRHVFGASGLIMVHLVVECQLFPSRHVFGGEKCNSWKSFVKCVNPNRVDNKVRITLQSSRVVNNELNYEELELAVELTEWLKKWEMLPYFFASIVNIWSSSKSKSKRYVSPSSS